MTSIDVFSHSITPSNHTLHTMPDQAIRLIRAFARPQLPQPLLYHISRVYHEGRQLAIWLIEHLYNDLLCNSETNVLPSYWTSPFAKVAPYVYREWKTENTVELSPYRAWEPMQYCETDALAVWLMVKQIMPYEWENMAHSYEQDAEMSGYFGVVNACRLVNNSDQIVMCVDVH